MTRLPGLSISIIYSLFHIGEILLIEYTYFNWAGESETDPKGTLPYGLKSSTLGDISS